MNKCAGCGKPNNIYATVCQHCGATLTPDGPIASPTYRVRTPCSKCENHRFLVIAPFQVPDPVNEERVMSLSVVMHRRDWNRIGAGQFHAYVCLGCGYTEWYALDLERLEALAGKVANVKVIEVPATPAYR